MRESGLGEAGKVIRASRCNVDAIAAALLERETLSGDEVREVVAGK
jgi:ATP-dependent Zn protease